MLLTFTEYLLGYLQGSQDKMGVKARRVAVIGAGPAGAIVTDALVKEQAFDSIRVFDRRVGIGGTW